MCLFCSSFSLKGMHSLDLFRASASPALTPGPALDLLFCSLSWALTSFFFSSVCWFLDRFRASASLALTPSPALSTFSFSPAPGSLLGAFSFKSSRQPSRFLRPVGTHSSAMQHTIQCFDRFWLASRLGLSQNLSMLSKQMSVNLWCRKK